MNRIFLGCLTLTGLALIDTPNADAQDFVPVPQVGCTITRQRPVVTTQLRPQQVTSVCDVTETQMTQRQVVENIPITTCKNVTRDEGGYQMVWVPKPVTRQVAETTIQQQVKTVAVPVQVRRRVPSTSISMVPVQTVQYVTEQVPVPMTAMAMPGCSSCGGGGFPAIGSPIMPAQLGYSPPIYPTANYPTANFSAAAIPVMPTINVPPMSQTASAPTPIIRSEAGRMNRNSYDADSYETVRARGVPTPREDDYAAPPRKTSMFSGVPSAAAVWQSQGSGSR